MSVRQRTQKKVFTPTSTPEPSSFLCKLIDTHDYLIVHRSSVKRLYDNTAEIVVRGRRMEAVVEFQGKMNSLNDSREIWERGYSYCIYRLDSLIDLLISVSNSFSTL